MPGRTGQGIRTPTPFRGPGFKPGTSAVPSRLRTVGGIRTLNLPGLNRSPLPIGPRRLDSRAPGGHPRCRIGATVQPSRHDTGSRAVHPEGVEPSRLAALRSKRSVYASSTTGASARRDSNPHPLRDTRLRRACMPFPAQAVKAAQPLARRSHGVAEAGLRVRREGFGPPTTSL
jgi:hypothetical protein